MTDHQLALNEIYAKRISEILAQNTETLVARFLTENPGLRAEDIEIVSQAGAPGGWTISVRRRGQ